MLDQLKLENVLFLDIETVPQFPAYEKVPEPIRLLWGKKALYLKKEDESPEELYGRAGIYAEFGKIVCIGTGMIGLQNEKRVIRLKSFYGDDEKKLLFEFNDMASRISLKRDIELCAHNGREFDYPFIARRTLVNGLKLPSLLDIGGKKPWEVKQLDTMELWKFGDHKHYSSLDLLATIFGIPSPKTDIDGSQVGSVYWKDRDLNRIVEYCQRDVVTVAQLILRYKGESILDKEDIIVLD
jgi:predicted PolB exonuclease-like 3'-5' exonuclease